jgi:prepilin-type N-terminal cleavage/methylation domain-containing protein
VSGLRARLAAARQDAGFSLTEVLVTMMIFTIIMAAATTLIIGFTKSNGENIARQTQIETGRQASEAMTRKLRTAVMPSQLGCTTCVGWDAFVVGQDFAMQFYANIDNPNNSIGPSRVTYSVATTGPQAGHLIEKVQVPESNVPGPSGYVYCAAEAPGASATCRSKLRKKLLAKGVQTTPGAALFSYYKAGNALMTPGAGASLASADLSKVLAVQINVAVRQESSLAIRPTRYIQRVTLPNAQAVLRNNERS